MARLFVKFDSNVTPTWIAIQVILISLIITGSVLLATQRYWVPDVVSFLLDVTEPVYVPTGAVTPEAHITLPIEPTATPHTITQSPQSTHSPTAMENTSTEQFSISVPRTSERGKPVTISWNLKEMPQGGSIGFFLKGGNLIHLGVSLTIDSIPLSGVSGTFEWDGDRYGCDPTDTPEYCTGIDTGEYTLTVVVYDKTDVSFVDGDTIEPVIHDEKVLFSASARITLTGTPHSERIESFAQAIAKQVNMDYLQIRAPYEASFWNGSEGNLVTPYITSKSPFTGPDAAGKFCMTFALTAPFAGSYTVCGPDKGYNKDTVSEFTVSAEDDIAPAVGVISFQAATQSMDETLWQLYRDKYVFKKVSTEEWDKVTTPGEFNELVTKNPEVYKDTLTVYQDWVYRTDAGGYWVFKLRVLYGDHLGHIDHEMIIRVDNQIARGCVVQHYNYADFDFPRLDIRKDAIQCP